MYRNFDAKSAKNTKNKIRPLQNADCFCGASRRVH